MKTINKIFFRGLITLLPIAVTIYILYSAVIILENLLGGLLSRLLPTYVPGLGLLMILIVIFLFGLLLNNFITAKFLTDFERRLSEVPFIKAIYPPLRDLMNLFSKGNGNGMKSVVLVDMGPVKAMGLITRENLYDLALPADASHRVAVYIPLSYGLGGFTFLVSRDKIQKVDIPIEKAMSLAITGWVKTEKKEHE